MSIRYSASSSSGVTSVEPACATRRSSDSTDLPPINIRVSVFIDGTGNNLFNTLYNDSSHMTVGDADHRGSYENSFSNVARLATNLVVENDETNFHIPVYVEGMGTLHFVADDTIGMGFGAGDRGMMNRVTSCINHVRNRINAVCNGNRHIGNLKIDVFGFSRGAAAARHFVYRVLTSEISYTSAPEGEAVDTSTYSLIDQLTRSDSDGYTIDDYKMPFVGLFDTVASYRARANPLASIGNDTAELHLNAIRLPQVEKVVHLAAGDEHRMNFPLTDIRSAGSKGTQIFLPGVHSDIGGGYEHNSLENNLSVFELEGDQFTSVDERNRMYERCNQIKDNLILLGWYQNFPLVEIPGHSPRNELVVQYNEDTGNYQVLATRVNISNKYSRVPLHIMKQKATEKQLSFNLDEYPISDDDFLMSIKSRVENNTSSDQQWIAAHDPQLKRLRHDYCHFSSHFTPILGGLAWPMQPQMYSEAEQWEDSTLDTIMGREYNAYNGIRRRRHYHG